MGKIEFASEMNPKMLIKLARKEIYTDKPNFMNAFLNLQDLKKIAKDKHDKEEMYKLYSELFFAVGNERLSKNALFRGCCANDNGGYYILDYTKFRYTEMLEEDEDLITLYNSKMNDSDVLLAYNDAYCHIMTGEYDQAFEILSVVPPIGEELEVIMKLLFSILKKGTKIDLTKYIYKLRMLCMLYCKESPELIRILLAGGKDSRKFYLEEIANFLENEIEDAVTLCKVAEVYFLEDEKERALENFENVIKVNPVDEKALYYLVCLCDYYSKDEGKTEEERNKFLKDKKMYLDRYEMIYEQFGAPVCLIKNMLEKGKYDEYMHFSDFEYNKERVENTSETDEEKIYQLLLHIEYSISLKNESDRAAIDMLKQIEPELAYDICKRILISPYVEDSRKEMVLGVLYRLGYTGRIHLALEKNAVLTSMTQLKIGKDKAIWNEVFFNVTKLVLFSGEFLPYNSSLLTEWIKIRAKTINNAKIKINNSDIRYLTYLICEEYNMVVKKDTNIKWLDSVNKIINVDELTEGLKKFPPEVLN